jgi:hypothetical protein
VAIDRKRFIDVSPIYYAMAICDFFSSSRDVASEADILSRYSITESPEQDYYCFLQKPAVFNKAVEWLADRGMIEALFDDFGPPIFRATAELSAQFDALTEDPALPFRKFQAVDNKRDWLERASTKLNETYDELEMSAQEFQVDVDEWSPIPLDRDDPNLMRAIEVLDEMVAQAEADNGYAATYPEERRYVIDSLKTGAAALKNERTTSASYLRRFVFDPLGRLLLRFGETALALSIQTLKEAFKEYLKQRGIMWFDTWL